MLFSDAHGGGARVLEAIQGSAPLADAVPAFTNPDWASHIGQLATVAVRGNRRRCRAGRRVSDGERHGCMAPGRPRSADVSGRRCRARGAPAAEGRQTIAERGDLDVLWRFDGNRFRTLDYETLSRTTPERFRELTTIDVDAQPSQIADAGYTAGPFSLPPGSFEARVWFSGPAARDGEVVVSASPRATFARRLGHAVEPHVDSVRFAGGRTSTHRARAQIGGWPSRSAGLKSFPSQLCPRSTGPTFQSGASSRSTRERGRT